MLDWITIKLEVKTSGTRRFPQGFPLGNEADRRLMGPVVTWSTIASLGCLRDLGWFTGATRITGAQPAHEDAETYV